MMASKESDLNLFTLSLTTPSLSVPVNKAEVYMCGCRDHRLSLLPFTLGRNSPKPTHTEEGEIRLWFMDAPGYLQDVKKFTRLREVGKEEEFH